jgi:hypothetical protein
VSYAAVTTLEPLITIYPVTVTEVVLSSVSFSYVLIYSDGHSYTELDTYLNSKIETVLMTGPQITSPATPTGNLGWALNLIIIMSYFEKWFGMHLEKLSSLF